MQGDADAAAPKVLFYLGAAPLKHKGEPLSLDTKFATKEEASAAALTISEAMKTEAWSVPLSRDKMNDRIRIMRGINQQIDELVAAEKLEKERLLKEAGHGQHDYSICEFARP